MKLLCDVCENAAASVICCADEAALCTSCDSRIHAANKLAGKHQRMPVLSERPEPAIVCDICQEQPSLFFCIEDRALLCRECDASIHSVNALAAKHRRFLLTGIRVGASCMTSSSASPEPTSAISLEHHAPGASSSDGARAMAAMKKPAVTMATVAGRGAHSKGPCEHGDPSNRATKRPFEQAVASSPEAGRGKDKHGGLCKVAMASEDAFSSEKASATLTAPKTLQSYTMNKQGTLSLASNTDSRMEHTNSNVSSNSTTISIQRISAGRVPFVAPVLTSLRAALKQENASISTISDLKRQEEDSVKSINILSTEGDTSINLNSDNIYSNVAMEADDCPPASRDCVSDYLVSDVSGWRLDELLTDLMGVYDGGPSLSPPKEDNASGSGTHEDTPWYTDLDFMAEHSLSPSEEGGAATVPEMPSPPTSSGMATSSRSKGAAQPWEFDYLFAGAHEHFSEFSVVPDIDGGHRASPPQAAARGGRGNARKKPRRGIRLDV